MVSPFLKSQKTTVHKHQHRSQAELIPAAFGFRVGHGHHDNTNRRRKAISRMLPQPVTEHSDFAETPQVPLTEQRAGTLAFPAKSTPILRQNNMPGRLTFPGPLFNVSGSVIGRLDG